MSSSIYGVCQPLAQDDQDVMRVKFVLNFDLAFLYKGTFKWPFCMRVHYKL